MAGIALGGASWALAIPLCLLAAALSGGLWAAVPGVLRARFGVHEVIATIMMNRIADAFINFSLSRGLAQKGTVRTSDIGLGAKLPRLEALGISPFRGSAVSVALLIGIGVLGLIFVWLKYSRSGRELVLVGKNSKACNAEGLSVSYYVALSMIASGAIAGLAASGTVLGYKGYFEAGLGAGAGFGGVAVALLGGRNPIGLLAASLFFGTLSQGGLAVNGRIPMEIMDVIQGLVVLTVAIVDSRVRGVLAGAFGGRR